MTDSDIYLISFTVLAIWLVQIWLMWKADQEHRLDKVFMGEARCATAFIVGVLSILVILFTFFGTVNMIIALVALFFLVMCIVGG